MDILRDKKIDLRIRRTHKLLLDALIALIEEQPFDKITVTDICDRAMIHRTTFYKHFEDKYHLLQFGIKEIQQQYNEEAFSINQNATLKEHCLTIFGTLLTLISNNKRLHILLSFSRQEDSVGSTFFELVAEDILDKISSKKDIPESFVASFYTGSIISAANWWLNEGMNIPIEDMLKYMDTQLSSSLN